MQRDAAKEFLRQANFLSAGGRESEAKDFLQEVWQSHKSRQPSVAISLARLVAKLEGEDSALDILVGALKDHPSNLHIVAETIRIYLQCGKYEQACFIVDDIESIKTLPLNMLMLFVKAAEGAERYQRALDYLVMAESGYGKSPIISENVARIFEKIGLPNEALSTRKISFERNLDSHLACSALAANLLRRNDLSECIRVSIIGIGMKSGGDKLAEVFSLAAIRSGCYELVASNRPFLIEQFSDRGRFLIIDLVLSVVEGVKELPIDSDVVSLSDRALKDARSYVFCFISQKRFDFAVRFINAVAEFCGTVPSVLSCLLVVANLMRDDKGYADKVLDNLQKPDDIYFPDLGKVFSSLDGCGFDDLVRSHYGRLIGFHPDERFRATKQVQLADLLASSGDKSEVLTLLDEIDVGVLNERQLIRVNWLRDWSRDFNTSFFMISPDIVPESVLEDGAIRHYRFGSTACFFWFSGVIPSNASVQLNIILPVLKDLGVSVMAILDTRRLGALGGFGRYFPDRLASESALVSLASGLGYKSFYTGGCSLAAYSALLYGCNTNSRGALVFSAPTHIPFPSEMPDSRGVLSLKRLRRTLDLDITDVQPLLSSRQDFLVHNYYGSESEFDVANAERISSFSNVRNFPFKHSRHDSFNWLHEVGELENSIRNFFNILLAVEEGCIR